MTTPNDIEPREQALSDTRDALAALHSLPAAGLDSEKAATVIELTRTVESLEKQLANEVEQLRAGGRDE